MSDTARKTEPKTAPVSRTKRGDSAELLMATAERLFAERGIDAVSLREIGREAGQRNNSALLYHFNSKQELIHRILKSGVEAVDNERNAFLDRLEARGGPEDVRQVVQAIVMPLASGAKTDHYVRFLAAAQMSPEFDLAEITSVEGARGFDRVSDHLGALLPHLHRTILRQRFVAAISFMIFGLADYERLETIRKAQKRRFDKERATANLVDMLTGAIAAPVSAEVEDLLVREHP